MAPVRSEPDHRNPTDVRERSCLGALGLDEAPSERPRSHRDEPLGFADAQERLHKLSAVRPVGVR